MRKLIKYLDDHIEEILLVFFLSAMSVIIFIQVVMRYLFDNSLSWSEELARYLFIWMTYIGISYGVKKNRHIKVDVALLLFPQKLRGYVVLLSDIIFMVFAAVIVYESFALSMKIFGFKQTSPAMGLPMGIVYLAPVTGFAITALRLVQSMIQTMKDIRSGVML